MSSLIASSRSGNVVSIYRTILSVLLIDIVIRKEVAYAWLSERFARRIIESRAVDICVHCCVTIEIVSLISAVHVRLLESLHFDVVVSCKTPSVYTNGPDLLDLRDI